MERLLRLVDELLKTEKTLPEFEQDFRDYYYDQMPPDVLTDDQVAFFSAVGEALDFTSELPDSESRAAGYITPNEFLIWLGTARYGYPHFTSIHKRT